MLGLIVRRLVVMIPLLVVVSFAVFSLMHIAPGDAATRLAGGEGASPQRIEEIRDELGLDDPLLVQYGRWFAGAATLDLGTSLYTDRPVMGEIRRALPVTLSLSLGALAFAVPAALLLGLLGLRPGGRLDRVAQFLVSIGIAVPAFWLAMVLVALFAVELGWVRPFGYTSLRASPTAWLQGLLLPAVSLGTLTAAVVARQLRGSLVDTMQAPYVRSAWAKGGTLSRVVRRHVLRNAALPPVTILGIEVGTLLGGAIIIERIFAIPGLGTYMLRSIGHNDIPAVQAVTLVYVVIYLLVNLVVDISYGVLNPKVRSA